MTTLDRGVPVWAIRAAAVLLALALSTAAETSAAEEAPPAGVLPVDVTLDDVLAKAETPPPVDYPDRMLQGFLLMDQLEYRIQDGAEDGLGWEGQAWVGYDYDRLWLKSEGDAVFSGADRGEVETDLVYSRWITAFWSAQVGVQHAIEWRSARWEDLWSAALALQGLAPGQVEAELALYVSEDADVSLELEGEYDLRVTQRLVLQPRVELLFSAQDVADRELGRGLSVIDLDLRLRYEIRRRFAPYAGIRYTHRLGQTADFAREGGGDAEDVLAVLGLRLAW